MDKILVLCDTFLQYTMTMLRAFNSDAKLSDEQWRKGIGAMRTWNNDVIKEECRAIRQLDGDIDELIAHATSKEVTLERMLPNFLKTLSQSHHVCDRSIFDLNFSDLGALFRRVTRRSLYLTSQTLTPNDSISQVMFRDRSGALKSWRNNTNTIKRSRKLETIPEPTPTPAPAPAPTPEPTQAQAPAPAQAQAQAQAPAQAPLPLPLPLPEVSRCFEKVTAVSEPWRSTSQIRQKAP